MIPNYEKTLQKLYGALRDNMIIDRKLKGGSILLSFLEITSNDRFRLLSESSIPRYRIPKEVLAYLEDKRFVRMTDEMDRCTMTAKGLWEIEKRGILTVDSLIGFLDTKFVDVFGGTKALSDREKVILFSMISARTFSEESPVNLKTDDDTLDKWKDILSKSCNLMKSLGFVKKIDSETLYGRVGNEHPVSSLMRRANDLPKKTRGIYKSPGKQQYYLDVCKDSQLSKETLSYLFRLLSGEKVELTLDLIEKISDFCRDIAYSMSPYVFDMRAHIFAKPEFDDIIRRSIADSVILR